MYRLLYSVLFCLLFMTSCAEIHYRDLSVGNKEFVKDMQVKIENESKSLTEYKSFTTNDSFKMNLSYQYNNGKISKFKKYKKEMLKAVDVVTYFIGIPIETKKEVFKYPVYKYWYENQDMNIFMSNYSGAKLNSSKQPNLKKKFILKVTDIDFKNYNKKYKYRYEDKIKTESESWFSKKYFPSNINNYLYISENYNDTFKIRMTEPKPYPLEDNIFKDFINFILSYEKNIIPVEQVHTVPREKVEFVIDCNNRDFTIKHKSSNNKLTLQAIANNDRISFRKDRFTNIASKYNLDLNKYLKSKYITIRVTANEKKVITAKYEKKVLFYDANRLLAKLTEIEANKGYGFIKFTSNLKLANVYINGSYQGQITENPFTKKLKEGKYIFNVKSKFYQPISIKAEITKNGVFAYNFNMVKAKSGDEQIGMAKIIQAIGGITVVTERNDLLVYLNGARYLPPFEIKKYAAGSYELKVVGPNKSKIINIEIADGLKTIVDLDKYF